MNQEPKAPFGTQASVAEQSDTKDVQSQEPSLGSEPKARGYLEEKTSEGDIFISHDNGQNWYKEYDALTGLHFTGPSDPGYYID